MRSRSPSNRAERRFTGAAVAVGLLVVAGALAVLAVWAPVRSPAGSASTAELEPAPSVVRDRTVTAPASGEPTAPASTAPSTTAPRHRQPAAPRPPDRPVPPDLAALLRAGLADPRLAGHTVGASIWVDGIGEVLAERADEPLLPASVQKLTVAVAALERLDPEFSFETQVVASAAPDAGGRVAGDLFLIGAGDPTLSRAGPHSLDALAAGVAAAGVRHVDGRLVVDASRWTADRASPGWLDWFQPRFVGWLSAVISDGNQWQTGGAALDPAAANGVVLLDALARHGVTVGAPTPAGGKAPAGAPLMSSVRSVERNVLVQRMLTRSDNLIAESLLRELGYRDTGIGSAASGTAVIGEVLLELGVPPGGIDHDGTGLSRDDRRSARAWRVLLQRAAEQPWWPALRDGLPLAGRTGTLAGRFGGTAGAGNVRAKTGTTVPARSLAGVLTTAGGRTVYFAVIVNGDEARPPLGAERAIDALIADLAAWDG